MKPSSRCSFPYLSPSLLVPRFITHFSLLLPRSRYFSLLFFPLSNKRKKKPRNRNAQRDRERERERSCSSFRLESISFRYLLPITRPSFSNHFYIFFFCSLPFSLVWFSFSMFPLFVSYELKVFGAH